MELVNVRDICVSYPKRDGEGAALEGVSFSVEKGELFAVLGASGSGKTSLAHALALLLPLSGGSFSISGTEGLWENRDQLRKKLGILFQNGEESFITCYLEDELAYAPLSLGMSEEEAEKRVRELLELVGLRAHERFSPQLLPREKRMRAALAAAVSAAPEILIADEPFASAGQQEREVLMGIFSRLRSQGMAIIMLTNNVEDAALSDSMLLLHQGRALAQGKPGEILGDAALLERAGLIPGFTARVFRDLAGAGVDLGSCPLTIEELVDAICR